MRPPSSSSATSSGLPSSLPTSPMLTSSIVANHAPLRYSSCSCALPALLTPQTPLSRSMPSSALSRATPWFTQTTFWLKDYVWCPSSIKDEKFPTVLHLQDDYAPLDGEIEGNEHSDLALAAAKAEQKVCKAKKYLADCILAHQSVILNIWRQRVQVTNSCLLMAELNVGRLHTERKKIARAEDAADVVTSSISKAKSIIELLTPTIDSLQIKLNNVTKKLTEIPQAQHPHPHPPTSYSKAATRAPAYIPGPAD
ncbi:hypothetical protein BDR07DRAFT_1477382 [Suillus spraguei]|nr:hypothetical protein BDR07DRAFT_1477382 [Suillus spraguei]